MIRMSCLYGFSYAAVLILHLGCAVKPNQRIELTDDEKVEVDTAIKKAAEDQLQKMVDKAKDLSPEQKKYVSTELFLKGNSAMMEGDFETGTLIFKYLVELNPDEYLQKKYAINLIRTGNLNEALKVLLSLYKNNGVSDQKTAMLLAGVHSALDELNEAKSIYKKILAVDKKNEDACLYLGKTLVLEKKNNEAKTIWAQCDENYLKSGLFKYYLGKLAVDENKLDQAMSYFKEALKKEPDFSEAIQAMGILFEQKENWGQAEKIYLSHIKNKPNDNAVLSRLVQVQFNQEKMLEVIPHAETLADLEPENLNLKVKLGVLYTDAKMFDSALTTFKELLELAPTSDRLIYYIAAIYQEQKKYELAVEYFNQVPTTSSLYSDSAIQMAQMLSTLAQEEAFGIRKSKEEWRSKFLSYIKQKKLDIKDLEVELGVIEAGFFENVDQVDKAINSLMTIHTLPTFNQQHQYYLASLYEREKRYSEATNLMLKMIETDPKNAHAWNFLGYSLLERGENLDQAFAYIQKALSINPDDGYIRDSLGWYYFKLGQIDQAYREISMAIKKIPEDIVIMKHLALIHHHKKDYRKAKELIEAALRMSKLESEKKELIDVLDQLEKDRIPASTP
jgi:Flp pilus assembly protein TadD